MATAPVTIDNVRGMVLSRTLPRVCAHCGDGAQGQPVAVELTPVPLIKASPEAAAAAGAALRVAFGAGGRATANELFNGGNDRLSVELPVCDACRGRAGRGIHFSATTRTGIRPHRVADEFAAEVKRMEGRGGRLQKSCTERPPRSRRSKRKTAVSIGRTSTNRARRRRRPRRRPECGGLTGSADSPSARRPLPTSAPCARGASSTRSPTPEAPTAPGTRRPPPASSR